MHVELRRTGDELLLRIGAIGAIVGSVLQVAAGTGSGSLPGGDAAAVLSGLAERPGWLGPVIYLGFIFGALLWVAGLVALAAAVPDGPSWALARLAMITVIVGVALHAIDGVLHGPGLASLASAWAAAPAAEQAALVQDADLLLRILDGSWAGVVTLFHGVPFVLAGLAVVLSRRYSAGLGWVGVVGGAGSLIIGVLMFLGVETGLALAFLAVPFAVVDSLFMVVLGGIMWSQAGGGEGEGAPR